MGAINTKIRDQTRDEWKTARANQQMRDNESQKQEENSEADWDTRARGRHDGLMANISVMAQAARLFRVEPCHDDSWTDINRSRVRWLASTESKIQNAHDYYRA